VEFCQSFEKIGENHYTVFDFYIYISWQFQRLHVIYSHEQLIVGVITYRDSTQIQPILFLFKQMNQ